MNRLILPPLPDIVATKPRPDAVVITGIRGYHQLDRFSCGAAVMHTLITARDGYVSADVWSGILADTQPHPVEGTPTARLFTSMNRNDLDYEEFEDIDPYTIMEALLDGDLVVTTIRQATQKIENTHWVVIAGASEEGALVLNSTGAPLFTKRWMSWDKIATRRDRFEPMYRVSTGLFGSVSDMMQFSPEQCHKVLL